MRALSLILFVMMGLAVLGLLYEIAAEQRRAQLRARSKRRLERINTPPAFRSHFHSHDSR